MLFDSCCRVLRYTSYVVRITTYNFFRLISNSLQQSSILLFSLSIYFFQYVKERYFQFAVPRLQFAVFQLPTVNCLLPT